MIEFVDNGDAEEAEFLVCVRQADLRPIDLGTPLGRIEQTVRNRSTTDTCSACGSVVVVDSISPKKPKRICLPCCLNMLDQDKAGGGAHGPN